MIARAEITPIGSLLKTHGVDGEMVFTTDIDAADIPALRCIVMDIDGIFVPFFIASCRSRGAQSLLITIDGVDSPAAAASFVGKTVYALKDDIADDTDDVGDDEGIFYLEDLIGYKALNDDGTVLGTIDDIDDQTQNTLFVISRPDPELPPLLIPAVDDFIDDINTETSTIILSIPPDLLNLN